MLRLGLRLAVRRSAMRAASSSSLINGGIIEHEDHGSAHADQGAVLLMRGSNATKSQWVGPHRNVVDELVAAGFRPITFDARNMGRSQRFGDKGDVGRISNVGNMFTVEEMADDAMGVLDAYGVERAHVVGCSLGGLVAQVNTCLLILPAHTGHNSVSLLTSLL
jgi:pimeloyl-ACP methyl ester carboxylesterase